MFRKKSSYWALCWGAPPRESGKTRRSAEGRVLTNDQNHFFPFLMKNRDADRSRKPKVPENDRSRPLENYSKNLRTLRVTQKRRTLRATPHEAYRRCTPKVAKCHVTCDMGRNVQVELSYPREITKKSPM